MYHTVVITCGVSFNQPNNLFSMRRKGAPSTDRLDLQSNTLTDGAKPQLTDWFRYCQTLLSNIDENPERVSAEYSMVHALRKMGKLADHPTISLFFTETVGGQMAEKLLKYVFEKKLHANVKVMYCNIDVTDSLKLNRQLGDYMIKLSDALAEGHASSTCFAPLGGYKVMTSYGYIVGSFVRYPTLYMHEDQQKLIEIPWVPIEVDNEFVKQNASFLRKCQNDYVPCHTLNYSERQLVYEHKPLFEIDSEYICLTPYGQFLLRRSEYDYLFDTEYYLSKQVQRLLMDRQDQSTFAYGQMRELVKKLKSTTCYDDELAHEKTFKTVDQASTQYHLYKGSSNGETPFRLAYKYDREKDALYGNYVWLDHNLYEREAAVGKGLYKEESGYANMTEVVGKKL